MLNAHHAQKRALSRLSPLIAVDYFARALGKVYTGPVLIIALVDWDPDPRFLMRPEVVSAEELKLFARPLRLDTPTEATWIRNWAERPRGYT